MKTDLSKYEKQYVYFVFDKKRNRYCSTKPFIKEYEAKRYIRYLSPALIKWEDWQIVRFLCQPILPNPEPSVIEISYEEFHNQEKLLEYMDTWDRIIVKKDGKTKITCGNGFYFNCSCVDYELIFEE